MLKAPAAASVSGLWPACKVAAMHGRSAYRGLLRASQRRGGTGGGYSKMVTCMLRLPRCARNDMVEDGVEI